MRRDPGETVDLNHTDVEALSMTMGWYLAAAGRSRAIASVSCRIDGDRAPVWTSCSLDGSCIILSATSPVGRPWMVALPRATATCLHGCLEVLARSRWEDLVTGGRRTSSLDLSHG